MTKVQEALKMCPHLVAVHVATYKDGEAQAAYHPNPDNRNHKVSLDLYRRESVKIMNMFKANLPGTGVGQYISYPTTKLKFADCRVYRESIG